MTRVRPWAEQLREAMARWGMAVMVGVLVSCVGCWWASEESSKDPVSFDRATAIRVIDWAGVSVSSLAEDSHCEITASSVSYRKRIGGGGLLVYHDLADLVIREGRLSIAMEGEGGFSSIPETIAKLLPRVHEDAIRDQTIRAGGESGEALPGVTRLVLEQPRIQLKTGSADVSLRAGAGQYDIRSGTLELDIDVVIRTAGGQVVGGPRAVLSRDHNGLYLPLGYLVGERLDPRGVFTVLDSRGRLSTTRGRRRIRYEDLIESRERLILAHYAKLAPPALRPLIAALLAGIEARGR